MQTNPDNSINTFKDLENKIDTYKGQIIVLEQEILSMKKVRESQEYSVSQNELKLKELKSFIEKSESDREAAMKDLSAAEWNLKVAAGAVTEKQIELTKVQETVSHELRRAEELKSDYTQRGIALALREESVTKREQALAADEAIASDKIQKINAFISSI